MNDYQHFQAYEWVSQEWKEQDGRLKHRKIGEVWGEAGPIKSQLFEPAFCYCGKPGGYVVRDTPILYVCQLCAEKFGDPPLPMVPGTENL